MDTTGTDGSSSENISESLVTKEDVDRRKQLYRRWIICLGLLCVVLLACNIGQFIYYGIISRPASADATQANYDALTQNKVDRLQSSYDALTADKEQLEIILGNLTVEKDQWQEHYQSINTKRDKLEDSLKTVTSQRDQLQANYSALKQESEELQASYNDVQKSLKGLETNHSQLAANINQIQAKYNNLEKQRTELQLNSTELVSNRDQMTSNINQLQTNYTNLQREKNELQTRFTALVEDRDQLETNYSSLRRDKEQLQRSFNTLSINKSQTEMSYNSLWRDKNHLQTRFNAATREKEQLQTKYGSLAADRDKLQKDLDKMTLIIKRKVCQTQWTKFETSCYFVSTVKKNWTESRQACIAEGADLVVINSRDEQVFVNGLLGVNQNAWIGLNDGVKEGVWMWVDGTPVTAAYWRSGQPNSYYGDQDCGEVLQSSWGGEWNDDGCFAEQNWICEK